MVCYPTRWPVSLTLTEQEKTIKTLMEELNCAAEDENLPTFEMNVHVQTNVNFHHLPLVHANGGLDEGPI